MRINGTSDIGNVYKSTKVNKAYGETSVSTSKDVVSFSSIAKDMGVAKKAIDQAPDVRMEKVDDIKAQIEAGQYNISASQIADKLLSQSKML
jgi:negative regulator of flagellin synthesis FlgM